MISKEKFIREYVDRSRPQHPSIETTADGYRLGVHERVALLCVCGDQMCEGWAMVINTSDAINDHTQFSG